MQERILRISSFSLAMVMLFSGLILNNDWGSHYASGANIYHRGDLPDDENWFAGNIHYIDDEFNITAGHTLTIEGGTDIRIDASHGKGAIVVKDGGKLVFGGSALSEILIDTNSTTPGPGSYEGIIVESGGIAFLNYTLITNATVGVNASGGDIELNYCNISSTSHWGVRSNGTGTANIFNSSFYMNGWGGNDSGGISMGSNGEIENCHISNSQGVGIRINNSGINVNGTEIYDSSGNGMRLFNDGNMTIRGCNVSYSNNTNLVVGGGNRTITLLNCSVLNEASEDTLRIESDAFHRIEVTYMNTTYSNDSFDLSDYSNLTVKWHVNVIVNNSGGHSVQGANVVLLNSNSLESDSGDSNSEGEVNWLTGTEFVYNQTGFAYDKYYRINVTHDNYNNASTELWIDSFNFTIITLSEGDVPEFLRIAPASGVEYIGGVNYVFRENITDVGSGVNDDTVKFWYQFEDDYDWYAAMFNENGNDSAIRINASNWSKGGDTYEVIMNLSGFTNGTKINFSWEAEDNDGNGKMDPGPSLSTNYSVYLDNMIPELIANNTPDNGTTGDSFTFSANFTDNVNISSVMVNFTYDNATYFNISMTNIETVMWNLTIEMGREATYMYYFFYFEDPGRNYNMSFPSRVSVLDNDPPEIMENNTPSFGTTGESFTFSADIGDNILLNIVNVNYTFDNITYFNISMDNVIGVMYNKTIELGHNETEMHYFFHLEDLENNTNVTPVSKVDIVDNDLITMGDNTSFTGGTGDNFIFNASLIDNRDPPDEISGYVIYWFGQATPVNSTNISLELIENTSFFVRNITIPSDSNASLYYNISCVDISGNWNETGGSEVTIIDNDAPVFNVSSTPGTGYTGDPFVFNCSWTENIELVSTYIEYWYLDGAHINSSMTNAGGDYFEHSIVLRDNYTGLLYYNYSAVDTSANWNNLAYQNSIIEDNDLPVFSQDSTPSNGETGGNITFNISIADNILVNVVKVNFSIGDYVYNITMNGQNPYTKIVTLPVDAEGTLSYFFWANDTGGNWNKTAIGEVTVTDVILPVLEGNNIPAVGYTGELFVFNLSWSDNINISNTYVEYWYDNETQHANETMSLVNGYYIRTITLRNNFTGALNYTVSAVDEQGNWNSTSNLSTIMDDEWPVFGLDRTAGWGVTGGTLNFTVEASDNVLISGIFVEYSFHNGSPVNRSMNGSGTFYYEIDLPNNISGTLEYFFLVADAAGHWTNTSNITVRIYDDQHPVFGQDGSESQAKTGNTFNFSTYIFDNIGLNAYTVEYWFGNGQHTNVSLLAPNPYNETITVPNDFSGTFYFIYSARDGEGNWSNTDLKSRTVIDDEEPTIVSNIANITTGDNLELNFSANDNVRVSAVNFYYKTRHTNGNLDNDFINVSLIRVSGNAPQSSERWNRTITVPGDAASLVCYYRVSDGTNSPYFCVNGETSDERVAKNNPINLAVRDNDEPLIVGDPIFDVTYGTNDTIVIIVNVHDNSFMIKSVNITFSGIYEYMGTVTLTEMYAGFAYNHSMVANISLVGIVNFTINISDVTGNWILAPEVGFFDFTVIDIIPPVALDASGNLTETTDDIFTISCSATDNIGVDRAKLYIREGVGVDWIEIEMNTSGRGQQGFTTSYPSILNRIYGINTSDAIALYYYIVLYDLERNMDKLGRRDIPYMIEFNDNDPPKLSNSSGRFGIGTDEDYLIEIDAADNMGLTRAVLHIRRSGESEWLETDMDSEISGDNLTGYFSIDSEALKELFGNDVSTFDGVPLEYYIEVFDVTGLFSSDALATDPHAINITDTIKPTLSIGEMGFNPVFPETGNDFAITIVVGDNMDLPEDIKGTLFYRFIYKLYAEDENDNQEIDFEELDSVFWVLLTGENAIPHAAIGMNYSIEIWDRAGNKNMTYFEPLDVKDVLPPTGSVSRIEHNGTVYGAREENKIKAGTPINVTISYSDNVDDGSSINVIFEYTDVVDPLGEKGDFINSMLIKGKEFTFETPNFKKGFAWYRLNLTDSKGLNYISPDYLLNVSDDNNQDKDDAPDDEEPRWESLNADGSSKGFNGTARLFKDDGSETKDSDGDGVGDNADMFPNDPAAAMDSDGDGYPDKWLPGQSRDNSTTWILLFRLGSEYGNYFKNGTVERKLKDAFEEKGIDLHTDMILDEEGWKILNGDDVYLLKNLTGSVNVYERTHIDAFPDDLAASVDTDDDKSPDSWNPGKTEKDSTTGLHIDEYPNNRDKNETDEIIPEEAETKPLSTVYIIILIVLIVIILGIIGFFGFKKVREKLKERKEKKEKEPKETKEKKGKKKKKEKKKKKGKKKDEKMGPALAKTKGKVKARPKAKAKAKDKDKKEKGKGEKVDEEEEDDGGEEPDEGRERVRKKGLIEDEDLMDESLDIDEMLPEEMLSKEKKVKAPKEEDIPEPPAPEPKKSVKKKEKVKAPEPAPPKPEKTPPKVQEEDDLDLDLADLDFGMDDDLDLGLDDIEIEEGEEWDMETEEKDDAGSEEGEEESEISEDDIETMIMGGVEEESEEEEDEKDEEELMSDMEKMLEEMGE